MIDVEKTIATAAEEMKRLKDRDILVRIPVPNLIILVSQLQLASRHPQNAGSNVQCAREFCEIAIGLIENFSPELAAFMRLGFDRRYDDIKSRL